MKTLRLLLIPLCLLLQSSHAEESKIKTAQQIIPKLEDCPAAVQASVKKNGHDAELVQIKRLLKEGVVLFALETGTEQGADRETTYFYNEDGSLRRTEQEIPLSEAPEIVRQALQQLAGTRLTIDDVEKVTEAKTISYEAELESNGGKDRKVRISETGEVLENEEEKND